MTEPEVEQKAKALVKFADSIGHPVLPYRGRESAAHRRWRMLTSVVRRLRLFADAFPLEPSMIHAYFDVNAQARRARAAMSRKKRN